MERGRVERDAEARGLPEVVPHHPARLRRHLGRPELAVRLEQPGEQHRHGSIVAPWRAASAGSCVHARYAFGETTSK
jgi:hypothetical protein